MLLHLNEVYRNELICDDLTLFRKRSSTTSAPGRLVSGSPEFFSGVGGRNMER
jgi:hypothetical protein